MSKLSFADLAKGDKFTFENETFGGVGHGVTPGPWTKISKYKYQHTDPAVDSYKREVYNIFAEYVTRV